MEMITLTKEQEEKWLRYIESNDVNFFEILFDRIKDNNDIRFMFSNSFLHKLFLKKVDINDCDYYYDFINHSSSSNLGKLLKYIDFSKLNYEKLNLIQDNINFMRDNNIILDLNKVFCKDISGLKIEYLRIDGSFDGYKFTRAQGDEVVGCTINNNSNKKGYRLIINPQKVADRSFENCFIKWASFKGSFENCVIRGATLIDDFIPVINPQKVKDKDLSYCHLEDVEFIGSFDGCKVKNIYFKSNRNTIINPQKVVDRCFGAAIIEDTTFTDSFDNCIAESLRLHNCENAYINGKGIYKTGLRFIDNIVIVINDDDDYWELKRLLSARHVCGYVGDNVTIKCSDIYYSRLKDISIINKCKFEVNNSQLVSDIDEVFSEYSNQKVKKL